MYPPPSSRSPFGRPPPSRSSADAPLTAERAMMDQIRSKLERAQRRLARNAPGSSGSSVASSRYIPASEYSSAAHRPPVKSVLVEDMASQHYAPPPSTYRQPPPSTTRHHGIPPSSSRPPSSKYNLNSSRHGHPEASRYASQQYKSRSKYSQGSFKDADPLNGGPPPMSTPYLVYSSSRPPMTGSRHVKSRAPMSKAPPTEQKPRHRGPPTSNIKTEAMKAPPSAMRSGVARPPSSRVRFEGHEAEMRESIDKFERDSEAERKRRQQKLKEREARHQRHREQEINARAKGSGPSSPIATRGRRSSSVEHPPSSAIKLSAYEDIAQAIPTSPVGRPRRSSAANPPPKSDIKISAFDDIIPRRRSSATQDTPPEPAEKTKRDEVVGVVAVETDADQGYSSESDNQETAEPPSPATAAVRSPLPSVVPEPDDLSSSEEEDDGDTSGFETDDSYVNEFSDFDVDSDYDYMSSGVFDSSARSEANVVAKERADSDDSEESDHATSSNQVPEADDVESPPPSELSTVKEEDEEPQPVSRLTARDLAFLALGRASSCSLSDTASPVSSATGKESPKNARVPMSYTPTSSAFPSQSRARGRPPVPATTGRARDGRTPPPAPSSSVFSYVRRSRARAPMDLKNQLPPSIGVLSGLSSGSSTFVLDPSYFYEVTWKSGEFAFSVQRVYTEENEFDDRNQEPQLFLRMLLNTERSTCKSFRDVRVGDVLIRVGDAYISDLGLEGSGTVLTKFFAKLTAQTPIRLTFQRMCPSDWEGGVEL